MKKFIAYLFVGMFCILGLNLIGGNIYAQEQDDKPKKAENTGKCIGVKLNTKFPIIGDCIGDTPNENATNAFPTMIGALTKIIMSLILVACFILIIVAGILRAADKPTEAKKWFERIAVTILLLGFSGAILRLINPNFFS